MPQHGLKGKRPRQRRTASGRGQEADALELTFRFFNEINIIAQLSTREMERVLPDGMTQSQFAVLNWFSRVDDQATPARLARAFQVTRGAMTNTLQRLSARGLVSVQPDPGNGRQKIVRCTAAGARWRERCIERLEPRMRAFLAQVPLATVGELIEPLQRVRARLDAARD